MLFRSLHGVDLGKSLGRLDFGRGFYVTDNKRKAIDRARKKTNDYNRRYGCAEDAYLVEVYLDEEKLSQLNYKEFEFRSKEWFEFVINNRLSREFLEEHDLKNHNRDNRFDIVSGEIADGRISQIANDIDNKMLQWNEVDYSEILPQDGKNYGYQYSFHTKRALTCMEIGSCDIMSLRENQAAAKQPFGFLGSLTSKCPAFSRTISAIARIDRKSVV